MQKTSTPEQRSDERIVVYWYALSQSFVPYSRAVCRSDRPDYFSVPEILAAVSSVTQAVGFLQNGVEDRRKVAG